jgi:hypothetical protein
MPAQKRAAFRRVARCSAWYGAPKPCTSGCARDKPVDVASPVSQVLYKTMLEDSKRGIATVRASLRPASRCCSLARCRQRLPPQAHAQQQACLVARPVCHTCCVKGRGGRAGAARVCGGRELPDPDPLHPRQGPHRCAWPPPRACGAAELTGRRDRGVEVAVVRRAANLLAPAFWPPLAKGFMSALRCLRTAAVSRKQSAV